MENDRIKNRREFIRGSARLSLGLVLGGMTGWSMLNNTREKWVWQIDPFTCDHCGRCATKCVKTPSAVKCVNAFQLCGYCDYCPGYYKPAYNALTTAAENQLCPTSALGRHFIEEPYFEYLIDEKLCIGCAKCVKGCTLFGNGSLHLQIMHHLCDNCNQCSIARNCPSGAIKRVKISEPYRVKGDFTKEG